MTKSAFDAAMATPVMVNSPVGDGHDFGAVYVARERGDAPNVYEGSAMKYRRAMPDEVCDFVGLPKPDGAAFVKTAGEWLSKQIHAWNLMKFVAAPLPKPGEAAATGPVKKVPLDPKKPDDYREIPRHVLHWMLDLVSGYTQQQQDDATKN